MASLLDYEFSEDMDHFSFVNPGDLDSRTLPDILLYVSGGGEPFVL